MEISFKFNIGDSLQHIGGYAEEKFIVMGRIMEECPGNIQKFYAVRLFRRTQEGGFLFAHMPGQNPNSLLRFHEEELEPIQDDMAKELRAPSRG